MELAGVIVQGRLAKVEVDLPAGVLDLSFVDSERACDLLEDINQVSEKLSCSMKLFAVFRLQTGLSVRWPVGGLTLAAAVERGRVAGIMLEMNTTKD